MSGPSERDEIAAVLAGHWAAGMAPSGSPHQWECACGEPLEMSDEAHVQHTADALTDLLAERDRRTAATALRRFADRFRPGDGNPWALHVRARARRAADRIERGE